MDQESHQDGDSDGFLLSQLNGANNEVRSPGPEIEHYTIGWICALKLELAASRPLLDEEYQPLRILGDDTRYVLGRIGTHKIVMVCMADQYGTVKAASVATNLKRSFPAVSATLMVGVAGGVPSSTNDLRLGDVVIGTKVWQYDIGKVISAGQFQATGPSTRPAWSLASALPIFETNHGALPYSLRVAELLRTKLKEFPRPKLLDHLYEASYEHHPPVAPTCDSCDLDKLLKRSERSIDIPFIFYGCVASGNRVIKYGKKRDKIAAKYKALCIEMETAGIMDELPCLAIRGICDYADSHKNKTWQKYAAAAAASDRNGLV